MCSSIYIRKVYILLDEYIKEKTIPSVRLYLVNLNVMEHNEIIEINENKNNYMENLKKLDI